MNIDRALKCDGWFSESEIKWVAKTVSELKSDGKIICGECGSWHGRSALASSLNMPANSVFYAIDTFLGSKDEQNSSHVSAQLLNGDHAFITFLQNTFDLVQNGTIIPLRLDSINAANLLKEKEIKFNFFFIDSAHDYDSVKREISAYLPLMKKNSILCGHDFYTDGKSWTGVYKAVNEFFPNVKQAPNTSIWYTTV